jgi:hypothetical protein
VEGEVGRDRENNGQDDEDDDDGAIFNSEAVVHPNLMERRLRDLVFCGSLNNMSTIHHNRAESKWEASGDPTEVGNSSHMSILAIARTNVEKECIVTDRTPSVCP